MITRVLQSLRDAAWHPTDEQLVAFIDAELGPRESTRVRRHLARCWACRGRERRLAETIDAFMDAYVASHAIDEDDDAMTEALLPHPARLPHAAREALRQRTPALLATRELSARETALSRAAAHVHVPPPPSPAWARPAPRRSIIVLLTTGVPLSARQVVRHVDRAERGVLAATPAPVIYQRLDIAVRQLPGGATTARHLRSLDRRRTSASSRRCRGQRRALPFDSAAQTHLRHRMTASGRGDFASRR